MADTPNAFPFDFRCQRSGYCCARPDGFVRVNAEDVTRIAGYLGLSPQAFRSRFVAADGERLLEHSGGRCIFLEQGQRASCRIHPVRPARCRSWPFWPELLDDPNALREARRFCPGIRMHARNDPSTGAGELPRDPE